MVYEQQCVIVLQADVDVLVLGLEFFPESIDELQPDSCGGTYQQVLPDKTNPVSFKIFNTVYKRFINRKPPFLRLIDE